MLTGHVAAARSSVSEQQPSLGHQQRMVHYAFTDRRGGSSHPPFDQLNLSAHQDDDPAAVLANREVLASTVGLAAHKVVFMRQVHADTVRLVGSDAVQADRDLLVDQPDCDGLVTTQPEVALAVLVADCVPVLLGEPEAGVVAAVHAGRKGLHNGVVVRALEQMVRLGAQPQRIHAWLGPCICGRCYEVPQQMAHEVARVASQALTTTRSGTSGLDLRQGLRQVLAQHQVHQVHMVGGCTQEDQQLFSYRRATAAGSSTGRMAGLVWLADRNTRQEGGSPSKTVVNKK